MNKYDVIIVGGACAGLTAGLYTSRRALKTLILTKDIGGQAAITTEIENYPGVGKISGPELMMKFKQQTEESGAEIKMAEVLSIEKKDNNFVVKTANEEFESLTLILAFGLEHRKLGLENEKRLTGRGIVYCATCDGPLFKNKTVGVVGAGNSAFDAADYLSDICEKVYIFARRDQFRAEQVLIDLVKSKNNVEILTKVEVKELVGEDRLEKVILNNNQEVELQGLFIEIGYLPKTEFLKGLVGLDEQGQIIVDKEAKTSELGIFAAGDITNSTFKQVVVSAGEGAKAGLSVARYLQTIKGTEDKPDWNRRK